MGYAVVEPDDVYDADDGRRVVLLEQDVLVLSPLATAILDLLAQGDVEDDDLVRAVVETFGEPPAGTDASEVVRANVDDLVARGLLSFVSGTSIFGQGPTRA